MSSFKRRGCDDGNDIKTLGGQQMYYKGFSCMKVRGQIRWEAATTPSGTRKCHRTCIPVLQMMLKNASLNHSKLSPGLLQHICISDLTQSLPPKNKINRNFGWSHFGTCQNEVNILSLLLLAGVKKKEEKVNCASRKGESVCGYEGPAANPLRPDLCSQPGH